MEGGCPSGKVMMKLKHPACGAHDLQPDQNA